jgi:hypothetical protein
MSPTSTGNQPGAEPASQAGKGEYGRRAKAPIKLPEGFEGASVQESIRIALEKCNALPLDLYKQWDVDGSGGIDKHEFARGLKVVGAQTSEVESFHASQTVHHMMARLLKSETAIAETLMQVSKAQSTTSMPSSRPGTVMGVAPWTARNLTRR